MEISGDAELHSCSCKVLLVLPSYAASGVFSSIKFSFNKLANCTICLNAMPV